MHYINPIDLLDLKTDNLSAIDGVTLRKAKKALLAEIELSDTDTINHKGRELTKSDCLRAIDELDNKNKRDFYLFIHQNKDLNNFLSYGDLNYFKSFKVESIYKLPDFVDFISPYFTKQYENLLSINFIKQNITNVKLLLSLKPIANEKYFENCYKSTYTVVKEIENEIVQIAIDIENKKSWHIENKFKDLPSVLEKRVNIELINLLPSYFQGLRNQLAESILNLARDINNDPINQYQPAYQIIEIANSISTDGLVKQTITKGYYTIKKNYENSIPKNVEPFHQQAAEPKPIDTTNESQKDDEKANIEVTPDPEKNGLVYWICLCLACGVGFFYGPVQKIILALFLITLLMPLIAFRNSNFSIVLLAKRNAISLAGASLGFFYPIIAQLYISYHFLVYLAILYDTLANKQQENKSKFSFYHYLAGAIVATILLSSYFGTTGNLLGKNNGYFKEKLTDKEYFQKGLAYFKQSNYAEAILQYDKAIGLNPEYAEAFVDRGACKANLGQLDSSIADYAKAQQIGLSTSRLYSNFGFSYYKLKEPEKALPYFEKALEVDSSNSAAYRWRGEIKYDKNDNKGAVEDYTKAISYNSNASNYFARGLAYYYLKNYKKAIQDMDKAIELNPTAGQYYYDRGDAKDLTNDFEAACLDWKTAKTKGYNVPEYKIKKCTPSIIYVPNGELSGCNAMMPKYNNRLDNKLLITVGNNASVAVKMINYATDKCIRYVFINKGTIHSIKNIPEGKYYLKIAYGEDWSIMEGQANCKGRFAQNTLFKKGEEVLDYNIVYSGNGYQVPSFSLKLDVIITEDKLNTFNTDKIDESEFYKN